MRFAVLGPLHVSLDAHVPVERPSHRRLLSVLLLDADRVVAVERLIDRFWPEGPPASAKGAVHTHIGALRKLVGSEVIRTEAAGYAIDLTRHTLDAVEFEDSVRRARDAAEAGRWDAAVEEADRALGLWRGSPFAELADDAFARPEVVRLEELRLSAVETRATGQLAVGRVEEALPDLERVTLEHPLRERLWELLMTARARLGRTADALTAYRDLCGILREMGLEPGVALRDLERRILREDPVLVPPRVRNNLPTHLTSFVGRAGDLAQLRSLLGEHRLVTLHGPGGTGKTRLAVELAGQLTDRFPDGIWLVDLAPLRSPSLVPTTVADTLGLRTDERPTGQGLRDALRHRETLLVLDNAEHLLDAATDIARRCIESGPGVSVLVTSRTSLGMAGELVYPVRPLMVTPSGAPNDAGAGTGDAVELFVQRAKLVAQDLPLTEETMDVVATICRRLDGLPLAIELAAARMGSLSPGTIADRLAEGFDVLADGGGDASPRHRSLAAMIEWSHGLLGEPERALFARSSVFAGDVELHAIEEVCAEDGIERSRIIDLLARLVESSLVTVLPTPGGVHRYRLLETLRRYAADRLVERGEADRMRERHRDRCLDVLETLAAKRDEAAWLEALDVEHVELEVALERSVSRAESEAAATIAGALARFWVHRRQPSRAALLLEDVLGAADLALDLDAEADLRTWLAIALHSAGHSDAALAEAERACELIQGQPPSSTMVRALATTAQMHLLVVQEDPRRAIEPARMAVEAARTIEDRAAEANALARLGHAVGWTGAVDAGLEHKREAMAIADDLGDESFSLRIYGSMFDLLMLHPERRRDGPRVLAQEILDRFHDATPSADLSMSWGWLAYVFLQSGEWDRAEDAVAHVGSHAHEGYGRMWYLHVHGSLRWMQGRLDEAAKDVAEFHQLGPAARWYHDLYSLQADIAADAGHLDEARAAADAYLAADVHASEESMKTGVLWPLVRAEVAAAVDASGRERSEHVDRAVSAHGRMRDVVERFPHPTGGSLQFETADTYLLLASAELSWVGQPDPDLWSAASASASYAYWRLYAQARRAEALMALGLDEEGETELRTVLDRAEQLGAEHVRQQFRWKDLRLPR